MSTFQDYQDLEAKAAKMRYALEKILECYGDQLTAQDKTIVASALKHDAGKGLLSRYLLLEQLNTHIHKNPKAFNLFLDQLDPVTQQELRIDIASLSPEPK
jgi:hypothetical protein